MSQLGYREVLALTLEQLGKNPKGQHANLVEHVLTAAKQKGLLPSVRPSTGAYYVSSGRSADEERVSELVREAMWECLIKRLIVFGMDGSNPNWPFYRLTEFGATAVKSTPPQPYDPDGFLKHFDTTCGSIDPAVVGADIQANPAMDRTSANPSLPPAIARIARGSQVEVTSGSA